MSGSPTSLLEFDSRERRTMQHHHRHPEILRFCLSFPIILVRHAEQMGIAKPATETCTSLHKVVCFNVHMAAHLNTGLSKKLDGI